MTWKPMKSIPLEQYVLVRLKGCHPATGEPFLPVIAKHIGNDELYSPDNDIKALRWGNFNETGDYVLATGDDLEWTELPQ